MSPLRAASFRACLVAFVVAGSAHQGYADDARALSYDLPVDVAVTVTAGIAWGGSELLKDHLGPLACRWCEANRIDTAVRDRLRWTAHPGDAITASNVAAYVVTPVVVLGLTGAAASGEQRLRGAWVDLLLIAQATALAGDLNQLVKFSAGRQRPFARAGLPNPDTSQGRHDNNLSFYSGHTSFTFSLAAAAGTIATLRHSRWAPLIWVAGGLVAATTGYLRIAADQHYLTDVLTGAILGAGVGFTVPYTFHRPRAGREPSASARLALIPITNSGVALTYARVF